MILYTYVDILRHVYICYIFCLPASLPYAMMPAIFPAFTRSSCSPYCQQLTRLSLMSLLARLDVISPLRRATRYASFDAYMLRFAQTFHAADSVAMMIRHIMPYAAFSRLLSEPSALTRDVVATLCCCAMLCRSSRHADIFIITAILCC